MLQRLGFPSVGEHRRFVTAIAVDAVGSGVFLPVSMLYFLVATPLSLVQIGAAISIASAASIPAGPVVGGIVDRMGAQRVLQVANVTQGLGFVAYLFVESFTGVLVATILVSVGRTSFWGSFGATVAVISRPGERELWFGFLGALRNVGFALGGLASGLAITIGTETAYAAIVVVNALSYALAYVLLRAVPNTVVSHPPQDDRAHEGWGVVLRDHRYALLVLTQSTFSMSMMALNFAMPIYATETLGLPGWVVGALFTLNTVMVGFGQGLLVRSLTGRVRNRVLLAANIAFGVSYVVLLGATQTSVVVATLLVLGGSAVYTLGEMLGGPVLAALAAEAAPDHLRGRYLAWNQVAWTATGAAAPVTFAALLSQGAAATWLSLLALSVAGGLLAAWLGRVLPQARQRVTNRAEPVAPGDPDSNLVEAPGV